MTVPPEDSFEKLAADVWTTGIPEADQWADRLRALVAKERAGFYPSPKGPQIGPLAVLGKWPSRPDWYVGIAYGDRAVRDGSGYAAFTKEEAEMIANTILEAELSRLRAELGEESNG